MKKEKIETRVNPQTQMCNDLATKFIDDLTHLLRRQISIMLPTIGAANTKDIIAKSLAMAGITLTEIAVKGKPGTFLAIVEHAMKSKPK